MTSTSSLAGKRVLVMGGSSGIGAAIVRRLASQGPQSRSTIDPIGPPPMRSSANCPTTGVPRRPSLPMSVTWRRPTRLRLFSAAARLVTTGRRRILRLARHWRG